MTPLRAEPNTVTVAANLPLSGELAVYGSAIRDGALFAAEAMERSAPDSAQIKFNWEDNRGVNTDAHTAAVRQLAAKPDIYVSGLKPQTMTINELVSKSETPHFTWILDARINERTTNNFRTWVSFKLEADAYLQYLRGKTVRKVAMLYVQLPSAEYQYHSLLAPALKAQGANDIWIEPFTLDTSDFQTLALKVKAFQPDLVILNGFIPHIVQLVKRLRTYKLIRPGFTLVSLDMLEAAEKLTPEELEGIVVAAPQFIIRPQSQAKTWREDFTRRFGHEPSYHAAFAYDMVGAITHAAKKLSLSATHEDWLRALRAVEYDGITGTVKFDSDGSSTTSMEPAIYQSGKLVPIF